jgi:hypothetical protein
MKLPIELICLIFKYIPKKKCYRCWKNIGILDKYTEYEGNIFCDIDCINYYNY